jgi:uncharacterized protein (TIGR02466 family)
MTKVYHWGPLLFHTQIEDSTLNQIKDLCIIDKNLDFKKELAGHIDNEYKINSEFLQKYLNKSLNQFLECFKHYYSREKYNLKIPNAWVNFMKKGEFNPPHEHEGDFSSVLYLDIPKELEEEYKKHKDKLIKSDGPGAICFMSNCSVPNFFIKQYTFFPKRGDMFIFPSKLIHYVFPFKSDIERVSIAYNIEFINDPST